jgi:hypothetical protein
MLPHVADIQRMSPNVICMTFLECLSANVMDLIQGSRRLISRRGQTSSPLEAACKDAQFAATSWNMMCGAWHAVTCSMESVLRQLLNAICSALYADRRFLERQIFAGFIRIDFQFEKGNFVLYSQSVLAVVSLQSTALLFW